MFFLELFPYYYFDKTETIYFRKDVVMGMSVSEDVMLFEENKFIKFIECTVRGIKADYYRKQMISANQEIYLLDIPADIIKSAACLDTVFDGEFSGVCGGSLLTAIERLTAKESLVLYKIYIDKYREAEVAGLLRMFQQTINTNLYNIIYWGGMRN